MSETKRFSLRIPQELLEAVSEKAKVNRRSINSQIIYDLAMATNYAEDEDLRTDGEDNLVQDDGVWPPKQVYYRLGREIET